METVKSRPTHKKIVCKICVKVPFLFVFYEIIFIFLCVNILPADSNMLKVSRTNIKIMFEICYKLAIKEPKQCN